MFTRIDPRWLALIILCLGDLMTVLDTTIVNVALPSIRTDLGFTEDSLVWVINAYLLTFAGFLLLAGRLGDLFGHRRVFLSGLFLFTVASLLCGSAHTQTLLIAARAVQGLGGAIISAVALSLLITLFKEEKERAQAFAVFGFVAAGGGAIGVFLGGLLTTSLDWHWVFLVNIPIGILVFVLCLYLLPHSKLEHAPAQLDILGAITVTLSLMLAIYAIVGGNQAGWLSPETLGTGILALLLFGLFLWIESRTKAALVPLSVFMLPNVSAVSLIGILWSAAMFAWFFLSALYMQFVLHYSPFEIGLAFLPANLIMALFSLGLSARIVMRFGIKPSLILGMVLIGVGLLIFGFAPGEHALVWFIIPAMTLLGLGCGCAFNPVLLAGTSFVPESEAGLASGVLNTAFMMGGSLGLAILASIAGAVTAFETAHGTDTAAASLTGYHIAFLVGSLFAFLAAFVAYVMVKVKPVSGKND